MAPTMPLRGTSQANAEAAATLRQSVPTIQKRAVTRSPSIPGTIAISHPYGADSSSTCVPCLIVGPDEKIITITVAAA